MLGTLLVASIAGEQPRAPLDGFLWGMPRAKAVLEQYQKLKAQTDNDAWQGHIGQEDALIIAYYTRKTQVLWAVSFIIGDRQGYVQGKRNYKFYRDTLTERYGRPTKNFEFYSQPYFEGDGRGDAALSSGKYTLTDMWTKFSETLLWMTLTPEGWVRLVYESKKLSDQVRKEAN